MVEDPVARGQPSEGRQRPAPGKSIPVRFEPDVDRKALEGPVEGETSLEDESGGLESAQVDLGRLETDVAVVLDEGPAIEIGLLAESLHHGIQALGVKKEDEGASRPEPAEAA